MDTGIPLRCTPARWLAIALCACTIAASGCRTAGPGGDPAPHEFLLLGEVHDNPAGHAARLALLRERIEAGWAPAIAMEQFDRERQAELDTALRECQDADCVIARAAPPKAGWQWPLYRPVIALALQHGLPLVAANLSRADASAVVKAGYAAALDAPTRSAFSLDAVPSGLQRAQEDAVQSGHCGQLPAAMLAPMARAQIARDVVMARAMLAAGRDVVLVAGNGHVRRDIAVPHWLRRAGAARVRSVGFVEAASRDYDATTLVAPVARPDPCAGLR